VKNVEGNGNIPLIFELDKGQFNGGSKRDFFIVRHF